MRRWGFFIFCVIAWTIGLLVPNPTSPFSGRVADIPGLKFYVSKTVHVGAYAFLTLLVVYLPGSRRLRFLMFAFLSLHGFVSEYLQNTLTTQRTGSLRDVLLDHVGILLGLLFAGVIDHRRSRASTKDRGERLP